MKAEEAEELLRWREEVRATPAGQKKDFTRELPRGYDPQYVEAALCALSHPFTPLTLVLTSATEPLGGGGTPEATVTCHKIHKIC